MDGDAADVIAHHLDLAGVQPDPELDADRPNGSNQGITAADRASRSVERGQAPVTDLLHFAAAEPGELSPQDVNLRLEELAPAPVAQLRCFLRRTYDVGEHDRREDPVDGGPAPNPGKELLDLVEHRVGVAREQRMVVSGQLDVARPVDVSGDVFAGPSVDRAISASMKDQGRRVDGRQRGTHVDVE